MIGTTGAAAADAVGWLLGVPSAGFVVEPRFGVMSMDRGEFSTGPLSAMTARLTKARIELLSGDVTCVPLNFAFISIASMNCGFKFVALFKCHIAMPGFGFGSRIDASAF